MRKDYVVSATAIFLIFAAGLWAQSSTGEIDVSVTDATEAAVMDAHVKITGAETGAVVRQLNTNASGLAQVPLLNPGVYNITVEKEGFKTVQRTGIVLRVTDVLSVRVSLEVGTATQSITIAGEASLVDTSSNAEGQVVASTTIQQLPLNGRNYIQLSVLTAGTVPSANKDASFSAFGNRGMQNVYLLDGGLNESFIRGIDNHQRDALRPSLEAIQEFKVQTSNYSAEYGSSAGGVVSVVTKSGTNDIHGSAFEFLRNSSIAAKDFFAPPGRAPLFVFNQYGGSLGGPIKRNRAWIFGAYQRTSTRQDTVLISTVPLPSAKSGVFTTPIYDPGSTAQTGNTFTRTLFPNNTIPAALFNSVGKAVASRYPDPNLPGAANNFIRTAPVTSNLHNATFRGDVQISSKDSMFARFGLNTGDTHGEASLPPPAATPVNQQLPAWNVGYGYTRVFSPTLVNEFRFSWTRPSITKDATVSRDEIVPGALATGVNSSTPTFSVTGYAQLGATPPGLGNVPLDKSSAVWEFSDNATKTIGPHLLKFGFTHQFVKFYTLSTLQGRGAFTMDGSYTQNPQSRTNTGSGLADLLLGYAQQVTISNIGVTDLRARNDMAYFQDDWKVTPRLTVNLGVRYELYFPLTEINNKLGNFVTDRSDPNFGHLIYADLNGQSRSLMQTDKNNFAPRFGFAYRVPHTHDLTVRGGYGMFYGNPDEQVGVGNMMTNNPPFVGAGGLTLIGDRNFASTAFNLSGKLPPTPAPIRPQDFVLLPSATAGLFSWPKYYRAPIVHQWNISFQKDLPGAMTAELGYVGNSGYGLWGQHPVNQPLTPGPGGVATRRPYGLYTVAPITGYDPWGRSHYEGMIARVERRFSKGLYFLASFTYGRAMDLSSGVALDGCSFCGTQEAIQDSYNLRAQYGPSDSNVPRRFVFSTNWDVPFGPRHRFVHSGVAAHIVEGWQLSAIWTAQDGSPFTLKLAQDNANVGNTSWPNRVCSGKLDHPTVQRWYDASCFPAPPPFTFGNSGRNVLYGPGVNNVDFAAHRFFPIPLREDVKLEFRGELFNLFNRTQFSMPEVTLGLPQTAAITATSAPNRQVQFALKLHW
jgi:Carboxypeptidase regulatory-like domain